MTPTTASATRYQDSNITCEGCGAVHNPTITPQAILCVDVGASRIKVGLLPNQLTFKELTKVKTFSFPSKDWLNEKLLLLFKRSAATPLSPAHQMPYSMISLSMCGPVSENRLYLYTDQGIPRELRKAAEEEANCEVLIENDAVCWAKGCIEYQKLVPEKLEFPCLAIALGTGVGVAFARDENSLSAIEISYIDCAFSRLKALLQGAPLTRWFAHHALGKEFFDSVFEGQEFQDDQMRAHLPSYNRRFQAFVEDLCEWIEKAFSLKVSSLCIGGGNSRFIEIPESYAKSVVLLSPQKLQASGISADTIQLLGCHRNCDKKQLPTQSIPSFAEIMHTWPA